MCGLQAVKEFGDDWRTKILTNRRALGFNCYSSWTAMGEVYDTEIYGRAIMTGDYSFNVRESYSYRMKLRDEISKSNMLEVIIGADQSNCYFSSHGSLHARVTARNSWREVSNRILSNRKEREARKPKPYATQVPLLTRESVDRFLKKVPRPLTLEC
jgi:hypothetical protein